MLRNKNPAAAMQCRNWWRPEILYGRHVKPAASHYSIFAGRPGGLLSQVKRQTNEHRIDGAQSCKLWRSGTTLVYEYGSNSRYRQSRHAGFICRLIPVFVGAAVLSTPGRTHDAAARIRSWPNAMVTPSHLRHGASRGPCITAHLVEEFHRLRVTIVAMRLSHPLGFCEPITIGFMCPHGMTALRDIQTSAIPGHSAEVFV